MKTHIFVFILETFVLIQTAHVSATVTSRSDFQRQFSSLLKREQNNAFESHTSSWFQERLSTRQIEKVFGYVAKMDFFANRNIEHLQAVKILQTILMEQETVDDVLKIAGGLRDHPQINPKLWLQAFISVKCMRSDMQFLKMPSLVELMPDDFIPRSIFDQAAQIKGRQDECILLDENFGADNGEENKMWYFREDLLINSHHWFWHIYYSSMGFPGAPGHSDRRGELFSFMHHEILARYATERMTNNLPRIGPINLDYFTPMEPYNSHLSDRNSGSNWTDRTPGKTMKDIYMSHPELGIWRNITVQEISDMHVILINDIKSGYLRDINGTMIPLDGFSGIDLVADVTEASIWSVNVDRYAVDDFGGFHNEAHSFISLVENPVITPEFPSDPGVMAGTSVSLRDPIFYRVHTAVENVFLDHKNTLTPYSSTEGDFPLKWDGVYITDFKVTGPVGSMPNDLETFWNYKEFNFTRGLDFNRNDSLPPVAICDKHLDHAEFKYEITVEKSPNVTTAGATVRIYIARRYDERGNRFTIEEQMKMFFSLDQFPITLNPGTNRITRNSLNSSLTIPFETWIDLEESDTFFQNCGCGLPHHLLIPRGSSIGTRFDLFVMITKGNMESQERIEAEHKRDEEGCRVAPLWCGVRGQKYPSLEPMGYPFDRRPQTPGANLEQFVEGITNMNAVQVRIRHFETS